MDQKYHHIRRLYLEKLTETISEEDDFELEKLLRHDAEARAVWDQLEKDRRDLNADIILARIDPEKELAEWKIRNGEQRPEATVRALPGWWRWAVALVVFTIGISYFAWDSFYSRTRPKVAAAVTNTVGPETDKIKLMLADGKSVAFSKDAAETYDVAGMQLENSGDQLKYSGDSQSTAAFNTLKVPATQEYSITLSDGTRVFLNSESTLRFPFYFSGETREVFIEGEAYLEVARDMGKPFIVHTPLTDIHVHGTGFNVNTYQDGVVRTSLVEGSVMVHTKDRKPLQLAPGLEAVFSRETGFSTNTFDAAEVLAWREGTFYFQNERLEDLSGTISRWFGVKLVFEKKDLAQHSVSGMLEKNHLEEFLHDLHKTSGISYSRDGDVLTLR